MPARFESGDLQGEVIDPALGIRKLRLLTGLLCLFFSASYACAPGSFVVNLQYRRLYQSMNSQYLKLLSSQVCGRSTAGSSLRGF